MGALKNSCEVVRTMRKYENEATESAKRGTMTI